MVIGTRPEAIKMAPVIRELNRVGSYQVFTCVSGQHKELLTQVLEVFDITPDFNLEVMQSNQDLVDITTRVLDGVNSVLRQISPDAVLVHGDTTTTFGAALCAFYHKIPIGHIEAGLRTRNIYAPFPEEANRLLTARLATWNFAPTESARLNLLSEGVDDQHIWVTGNTVVDSLVHTIARIESSELLQKRLNEQLFAHFGSRENIDRLVLITGHRRESFQGGLKEVGEALIELATTNPDVIFVYPVHPNPSVRAQLSTASNSLKNLHFIAPLDYLEFIWLMIHSCLIITDSGGIQEEAPFLGIPLLVLRELTERPEGVTAGCVELVGTDKSRIIERANHYLQLPRRVEARDSEHSSLYGDGLAGSRIAEILLSELGT